MFSFSLNFGNGFPGKEGKRLGDRGLIATKRAVAFFAI